MNRLFVLVALLGAPLWAQFFGGGSPWRAVTVPYSATPLVDLSRGTVFTITLTGDAAPTFTGLTPGKFVSLLVCQDATGGRAFNWPTNATMGAGGVSQVPNLCTAQAFLIWGTVLYALSGPSYNDPVPPPSLLTQPWSVATWFNRGTATVGATTGGFLLSAPGEPSNYAVVQPRGFLFAEGGALADPFTFTVGLNLDTDYTITGTCATDSGGCSIAGVYKQCGSVADGNKHPFCVVRANVTAATATIGYYHTNMATRVLSGSVVIPKIKGNDVFLRMSSVAGVLHCEYSDNGRVTWTDVGVTLPVNDSCNGDRYIGVWTAGSVTATYTVDARVFFSEFER